MIKHQLSHLKKTFLFYRYYSDELQISQKSTLTQYGCKCNSSVIKLTRAQHYKTFFFRNL